MLETNNHFLLPRKSFSDTETVLVRGPFQSSPAPAWSLETTTRMLSKCLRALAGDLVRRQVSVIASTEGATAAFAANMLTRMSLQMPENGTKKGLSGGRPPNGRRCVPMDAQNIWPADGR
jgi:hypothetical protein